MINCRQIYCRQKAGAKMEKTRINDQDVYLYHQGTNYRSYQLYGAHLETRDGVSGVRFFLWAPHAQSVSVVGDFNDWQRDVHPMQRTSNYESWELFIPALEEGAVYKYAITAANGEVLMKADPYAFFSEVRPNTASVVADMNGYDWHDEAWQAEKEQGSSYEKPMLIYEVHMGSWQRNAEGEFLTYRENADRMVAYVKSMNYTHIELLPLSEYPFDGSWGYQGTGYYSVTSRYGSPQDFMYFVDKCHQNGIGVIIDWVPGHFCRDAHGLRQFDGQNLYESDNPQLAENTEWGTTNFDYGRTEVQSFLISNAMFWFDVYHIDGLRIDAVANMLYLNYGRKDGEWTPNKYGGNGNLEAMEFLRKLNMAVFKYYPSALMIAEESTSWPMISKPVYMGGMGFNYKWNMGWMNDMLKYMSLDPIYRKWNHNLVTFSFMYAFSENFVLPLSHDEVVHGKHSLLDKMPGDYWQKFANLRVFFAYWMAHPGKKLMFMGGEFGQFIEWKYDDSLDWHLLDYPLHQAMYKYCAQLNQFYKDNDAFWQIDCDWHGFEWIDCNDSENSVVSFIRKNKHDINDVVLVVCNFTPEVRNGYRVGVPVEGVYEEVFNSDRTEFGGSNVINEGEFVAQSYKWHNRDWSIQLTLPPLGAVYFKLKQENDESEGFGD